MHQLGEKRVKCANVFINLGNVSTRNRCFKVWEFCHHLLRFSPLNVLRQRRKRFVVRGVHSGADLMEVEDSFEVSSSVNNICRNAQFQSQKGLEQFGNESIRALCLKGNGGSGNFTC